MPTLLPNELLPLAKMLEHDEPRVVVLVGAGITIGATASPYASWLGLLKHGVEHLVDSEVITRRYGLELLASLDAAFSPFNLGMALQHAELVEQNLKTPTAAGFDAWLRAAFQDLKVQSGKSETLDALHELQSAGALLLTTNYDSLLTEATGLPAVTWEEHDRVFQMIRGREPGVLHIHGHWQRPTSVVLGRTSYDRIVHDGDFQDVFKSLWLERSWLYVGCGDGLGDPNLGRLLEWGKRWKKNSPPDYFLVKGDLLPEAAPAENPGNIVNVKYSDFQDLPPILRTLCPAERCWPFVPVDDQFALFRNPGSPISVPFPSREEYLDGRVPPLASDAEVLDRLNEHGWAFILDVASVGKTTLALRMASAPAQRDHSAHYLDLATNWDEEAEAEATAAFRRLARLDTLLIVDNVHHKPELARRLWDQWQARPVRSQSKLLLIATRIQRTVTDPAQDLGFFERHPTNPAIALRPAPEDLWAIVKHLYWRMGILDPEALHAPPSSVLQAWHREYGNALGAFCLAAQARLADFRRRNWDLPAEAASDWVRKKWLDGLDSESLENVSCLAVFGAQELELQILNDALPHPGRIDRLMRLGLVAETVRGDLAQYRSYSLREPGWGRLILASRTPPVDEERVLFETAARHPLMALFFGNRLRHTRNDDLGRLWAYLASAPQDLLRWIPKIPLSFLPVLVKAAEAAQQSLLANRFLEVIESSPAKLAELALETPLQFVASFLDTMQRHHRNTTPFWEAIEREPRRLAARVCGEPLNGVAAFLETAQRQQRNTTPFWEAIEREPGRLAELAWETPLHVVASFLDTAQRQKRNTTPIWEAIEREPRRLAERALETPLNDVAALLDTAQRQKRNTTPLWEAIEREPERLAERAWGTALGDVTAFLETAHRQKRNTTPLWDAIEREPERLAERAWETPLQFVASFLETAQAQKRNPTPLWEAIEREPERFAERVWGTALGDVAAFLETAQRQKRNTKPLWEAIEREPRRLAERAWETPLNGVAAFMETAQRQQRNTTPLWEAIEPARLAARVRETPLSQVASFQTIAKRQGCDIEALWQSILENPEELTAMARKTSVANLAGFCRHAPPSVTKIVLEAFQPTDWDEIPVSESLRGATWLAYRCGEAGRLDLASSLIRTLLRRAYARDFPPSEGSSLVSVAWLLANVPLEAESLVPPFLDVVCTKSWLTTLFRNATYGQLAGGLRLLALHQPPEVFWRFETPHLAFRLQRDLWRLAELDPHDQSEVIQLVGSMNLCGWTLESEWFNNLPLSAIASLPVNVLAHRTEATRIEDWQFQLWLGLRAVSSIARQRLSIPAEVVARTLELWRVNLAESSVDPTSRLHAVNREMVAWLADALDRNEATLAPTS